MTLKAPGQEGNHTYAAKIKVPKADGTYEEFPALRRDLPMFSGTYTIRETGRNDPST